MVFVFLCSLRPRVGTANLLMSRESPHEGSSSDSKVNFVVEGTAFQKMILATFPLTNS